MAFRMEATKSQKTKKPPEGSFLFHPRGVNGAVEKTRTSTPCGTATSTLRVYQFRHDRTPVVGAFAAGRSEGACSNGSGWVQAIKSRRRNQPDQPILKIFSMTSTDR